MNYLNRASARFFKDSFPGFFKKAGLPGFLFLFLISIYTLVHLFTLSLHPFVHSDEAWLAVLSRAMMVEKTPAAVEEVFRLTPRYPHVLKTLYHLVQAPFLAISWSAFSARFPSLIAGGFSLLFVTRIASVSGMSRRFRYLPALFISLDPQFWYASHLGRQEMMLTTLFLFSWNLKSRRYPAWMVALPLCAGIFVHPNAFIISIPIAVMYLVDIIFQEASPGSRERVLKVPSVQKWRGKNGGIGELFLFGVILAASAALALGFSHMMDAEFFKHYSSFGNSVGAGDSLQVKLLGFPLFLAKMWHRNAGTYYLADIRPMLTAGFFGFLVTFVFQFPLLSRYGSSQKRTAVILLTVPISLATGMIAVGKYAPPTITFLMPPAYLITAFSLDLLYKLKFPGGRAATGKNFHSAVLLVVSLLLITLSVKSIREVSHSIRSPSYSSYRDFLRDNIGGEGRILANLNTAFAFDYDRLVIWRDLSDLGTDKESLDTFLKENDVRWVVLSEELEFIYKSRPVWNTLYGNPFWYSQLTETLKLRGTETADGIFPDYAMRIVPYMKKQSWSSVIYQLQK